MKKLIVLENINGNFGKSPNGKLYHYDFNNGIIKAESYDIYLVDTEESLTVDCKFISNDKLYEYSFDTDDVFNLSRNCEVVVASTDIRTKLPSIPQFVLNMFLENTEMNWLIDYGTTENSEYASLGNCDFIVHDVNKQICEDYPIQDDIWASRRWNLDHTDYCDLSGFENEWIGVDTTLDLDLITPEDLI